MSTEKIEKLRKENELLKKEIEKLKSVKNNQKTGMIEKASQGNLMSRAPFGYEFKNKQLIPGENAYLIEEIFQEFLENKTSLRKLAQKYDLSINGLKKVLRNFTYIGKVKFNNEIYNGIHQPLISSTLFNHVQDKLEKLEIK